jgi:TPR repeat protein
MPQKKTNDLYETALVEANKKNPDNNKVLSLLTKSLEEGNPKSAYALGTWYLHGYHVKKNLRKAIQLLRKAARENISEALFDLAVCYEKGAGVKKNEKLALEHYLCAALHGDEQSVYEVGRCYYHGIGVDKNRRVAKVWLDRASELGIYEQA